MLPPATSEPPAPPTPIKLPNECIRKCTSPSARLVAYFGCLLAMVNPAWWGAALVLPAAATLKAIAGRGGKPKQDGDGMRARLDDAAADPSFVCERVCTSPRLMRRMGSLAKDATPNTCVTVCGTSSVDACTDACQRAVCTTVHQVPAWNDNCLSRCSTECQRGRT